MDRVVGRSELVSEHELSPPSSPDVDRLRNLGEFDFVKHHVPQDSQPLEPLEDEELEFVLFASTTGNRNSSEGVAKIRIQTPPIEGEPRFIVPSRHTSYYFAQVSTDDAKERFTAAAVSGQDVLARSNSPWPGTGYNWKVFHIPTTKRQRSVLCASSTSFARLIDCDVASKRKRPGKKARLKARTKLAAARDKHEQKQKAAELKEAAEREKRTRRNREKKVKKKQRDKAKKAEAGTAADGPISAPG